jgi:hypothetical protein
MRIAIGAAWHNENGTNLDHSGEVRLLDYSQDMAKWVEAGNIMVGENNEDFGKSVRNRVKGL